MPVIEVSASDQDDVVVINTDGSATFASNITTTKGFANNGDPDYSLLNGDNGRLSLKGSFDDHPNSLAINVYNKGNLQTNRVFGVGYDGSATFASAVNVNRPDGSTADGFAVLSGAKKRVGIDAAGDIKLGDNILVDEAIYLKGSDGTAIFKGDYVLVGPNPGNSADNTSGVTVGTGGVVITGDSAKVDSDYAFVVTKHSGSGTTYAETARINNDGSEPAGKLN